MTEVSHARFWCIVGHYLATKHAGFPLPQHWLGGEKYAAWTWTSDPGKDFEIWHAGLACRDPDLPEQDIRAYVDDVVAGIQRDAAREGFDVMKPEL
jgi:hypothetical protein